MSSGTREPIVMPGLSDMDAGTVVEWRKASGETVERGEIVAVIDADKVSLDVEAPATGTLEIIAEENAEVAVGEPVGWVLVQ